MRLDSGPRSSNLHIRCFLGAIQLPVCLIYLIQTCGNVQTPIHTANPRLSMLLLYVRWLSRGIKTELSMLSAAPKAPTFSTQTPSPKLIKIKGINRQPAPSQMYLKNAFYMCSSGKRAKAGKYHRMKIESPLLDWFRDLFTWSSPRRSSGWEMMAERSS